MVMTAAEYMAKAKELFGDNKEEYRFKCSGCGRIQSAASVKKQIADGIPSQRYGMLKKGDSLHVEQACFAPDCNWVANGLFTGPILVIIDPEKPHDRNRLDNCTHVFALDGMDIVDDESEHEAEKGA